MTVEELLNKRIAETTTYNDILLDLLGDFYYKELDKIKQMSTSEFYEYFEQLLGEED